MKWPRLDAGAVADATAATERFARISPQLASEFVDAFARSLEQIAQFPRRFPRLETDVSEQEIRRVVMHRFNYVIIYEMFGDAPAVAAVVHASQQPDSWRTRREQSE